MATRAAPVLLLALILLSCCHCRASRDFPAAGDLKEKERAVVIAPMSEIMPKCDVVYEEICSVQSCTLHCLSLGLSALPGYCNVFNMEIYCCCPFPDPPPPRSTGLQP